MHRKLFALALAGVVVAANAQLTDVDPDWKEAEVPPPPALRTEGLIPVTVSATSLRFGLDPKSISVGKDGVVRYVVVATSSSGAVNGMYEGVRCTTGEVKTYARYHPGTGWSVVKNPDWQKLEPNAAVRHSWSIARAGVCRERAPNMSPAQIVQDLQASPDRRFEGPGIR